jgi:ubiquinone/menaquinone biosynthesis C-methylase UbiE
MLAVAERKNVYSRLHCLALGDALPFVDGHFAGIVCAGVFTTGHVGPEGLDELVRICRPVGVIVLTVKGTLWDGGFGARIAELEQQGQLQRLEQTPPYVSMPGEAATTPSLGIALKRL